MVSPQSPRYFVFPPTEFRIFPILTIGLRGRLAKAPELACRSRPPYFYRFRGVHQVLSKIRFSRNPAPRHDISPIMRQCEICRQTPIELGVGCHLRRMQNGPAPHVYVPVVSHQVGRRPPGVDGEAHNTRGSRTSSELCRETPVAKLGRDIVSKRYDGRLM